MNEQDWQAFWISARRSSAETDLNVLLEKKEKAVLAALSGGWDAQAAKGIGEELYGKEIAEKLSAISKAKKDILKHYAQQEAEKRTDDLAKKPPVLSPPWWKLWP